MLSHQIRFSLFWFGSPSYIGPRPVSRIPEETIQQILSATDIVDLISSYLPLKKAGTSFKACCPFHNEKTPSFHVNPARQNFHCFGCGEGGNAIGFVMKYENLPFPDVVKRLASRAGIAIIEEQLDPVAEKARRSRGKLLDFMRETTRFMHELLMRDPAAAHARSYLKSRGYGGEMAKRWEIGWMPDSPKVFLDWARSKKFSGRDLVDSGMAYLREENVPNSGIRVRFRDRLMFPIRNEVGDVIGFSGRQLREDPRSGKYVNSPETQLFSKSRTLFALDRSRRAMMKQGALLCEGQLDVIACHEHGVENAIATQGTACTQQHARLLKRYTNKVVLCYDADNAGIAAMKKAFLELAPEGFSVQVLELPAGQDPDSYLQSQGAEAFRTLLENARDFFDYHLDHAASEGLTATTQGRATVASTIAPLLASVSDPMAREVFIAQVATRLGIGPNELIQSIARAGQEARRFTTPAQEVTPRSAELAPTPIDPLVAHLCHLALESHEAQEWLAEQFEILHESSEYVIGIGLLETILDRKPDAANPAAVNAFLLTLEEADRLALQQDFTFRSPTALPPLNDAEETVAKVTALALMRRDERIHAALKEPGLSPQRILELMAEAKELQTLLSGLDQRFINRDRYIINKPLPKKDFPNSKWSRQRKP